MIISGTHKSHSSDKSTTKSFLKKGGGRRGSCLLETKVGQKVRTLQAGLCLLCCDPEGHGVRPCRADRVVSSRHGGQVPGSLPTAETKHCTAAREPGCSAGGPSAQRGPGSEAQWAHPPASRTRSAASEAGMTPVPSAVTGPGWAGASLRRTALLPCQLPWRRP